MKKMIWLIFSLIVMLSCSPPGNDPETKKELSPHDQKMEWWREARFGMFIHWGLYAIPGGEWEGQKIPGISEWIMARAKIPVKEYEKLAGEFNPVEFDADAWVKLAKQAGMKYIVITSKHHDGFAMFHSRVSPYNIVDATPFKRDPLKELAEACKKYGIRLGFYYSQAQDWHERGGTYFNIEQGKPHWDPDLPREPLMNYIQGKALPQVKEILENYGGLDIVWWDTPRGMTEEAARILKDETDKYPALITNNRLYGPWPGDFGTPEQHVPPTGLDYDWEVCMTMNTSWGYKWYDDNWKSTKSLIQMLVDIASKGGNLLLNVGPDALGRIPEESALRLKEIGIWMRQNGESIYGTTASPFFKLPWGRCTTKETQRGHNFYLHVFDWPKTGVLKIPRFMARVKDVYLLSNPKQKFAWKFEDGDLIVHAPSVIFDPINTVIVVKVHGEAEIKPNMPAEKNGRILLMADFADIYNPGYGEQAVLQNGGKEPVIRNWTDERTRLEWFFNNDVEGDYRMEALIKNEAEEQLNIRLGEQKVRSVIPDSGDIFEVVDLGTIQIGKGSSQVISLQPERGKWSNTELIYLELIRK